MSRILFINSVCNGSTGTICKNLYKAAEKEGHDCCIAYGRGEAPAGFNLIKIGNKLDVYLHVLKARLFDASGFVSKKATSTFIKHIDKFKPDVIHLHNIHGYYINIEILFNYLKEHPEIKKIWTLHDCWAYTGHCAYYTYVECEKWKTVCKGKCANKGEYPKTMCSNIENNFNRKKKAFNGLKNSILVTPSEWLKNEVELSYLKDYPLQVINNGIDLNIFKPTKSNLREINHIENKKIILGVASVWNKRKGLDAFIELSKELDNHYQIVLIGLTQRQIALLPENIIGIERTESAYELAKWYSLSTVFFNPTLEDNYPTTNMEAIACGTPVVTFNTGGSPESAFATDENIVFTNSLKESIQKIQFITPPKKMNCSLEKMSNSYLKLYRKGGAKFE